MPSNKTRIIVGVGLFAVLGLTGCHNGNMDTDQTPPKTTANASGDGPHSPPPMQRTAGVASPGTGSRANANTE